MNASDTSIDYLRTMYTDPASKNARAILEQAGWHSEPHPGLANFIWLRHRTQHLYEQLRPDQLMNHIPRESVMCDKGHLTESLRAFDPASQGIDLRMADFYSETYCLHIEADREAFFAQIPAEDSPENLWILKPTDESRGIGVALVWELNKLKTKLQNPDADVPEIDVDLSQPYVIQRYIKDPLLLDGHKSEIRLYWLIACLDPLLVLLYEEGTARRNALPFQWGDFDNPLVHITNAYQQKKHHPEPDTLELKWRFAYLQTYLSEAFDWVGDDFMASQLKPQWKQMLSFVVCAARETLMDRPDNGLFWGLYGADVILDNTLRPWLTEVQLCPGLSHDDDVKKNLIPRVVREAAEIVAEVQKRKRAGESLAHLDAMDGFEWVINEA